MLFYISDALGTNATFSDILINKQFLASHTKVFFHADLHSPIYSMQSLLTEQRRHFDYKL